ncbi:MAG: peptidylprolyl isomerase [Phycisphaerales bacterium]
MNISRRMQGRVMGFVAAGFCLLAASTARSQVSPDRLYYGIGRAIPMTIAKPADAEGAVTLQLTEPVTHALVEKAEAAAGAVNLAEKFPALWTTSSPRLLYLQLVVGDKPIGAPVVLQPLVSPTYASRVDGAGNPMWETRGRKIYSGIRAYVDKHVVLDTSKGEVELAMRPDQAPNTVWSFRGLVEGGYYTEVIFHRIADLNGDATVDILQVGDPGASNPQNAGQGGPGFNIDLEQSELPHDLGVISMARTPDPNSNGSQVFLCLNKKGTSFLDGKYTTFGKAVKGEEVLMTLGTSPTDSRTQRPIDPPMIKSARLVDAPPIKAAPGAEHSEGSKPPAKPANEPPKDR